MEKYTSSDMLYDLAEVVRKNNIFKFIKVIVKFIKSKNIKVKKRDCNRNEICTSL